jgi:hypothetical protein
MVSSRSGSPYPQIAQLGPGVERPFWSVMIPTYHCAEYLAHTLRSVLGPGAPGQ